MADSDGIDGFADTFTDQVSALERTLTTAQAQAAAFDAELGRMRESMVYTSRETGQLSSMIGRGLRSAFDGLVFDGLKLSEALKGVAETMAASAYSVAMKPVQNAAGGAVATGLNTLLSGLFPFADGAAFSQGRVMPFAKGGVVSQPTAFPMRGATGLMGEAGAEAILPLTRGADGRLGVQSLGEARQVSVVMNVQTQDAASFSRSQGQIAARINRALARGERNR